jgi:EAL domain-containing protein (putative c-di-GMP-specific phosphodiesterase class I)
MALLMEDESAIQKNIADKLIAALKTGGFVLYAQKILSLGASRNERPFQEVLVRFKEEEEKLLPPGTFFPMLQEYRLLPYVDRWVVSRLATWIQESRSKNPGWQAPVNGVNLSEDTLREATFSEFVARNIQNSKLPDGTFTFEVSWDTALVHSEDIKGLLSQLRPLGCRFTFAGFDGSDGSFSFLKVLKPDFVKLSYGIVKDIGRALAASERAESINQRVHAMGIKTIAEFVESNDVLENLKLVEVDYAQGLVIGGPQKLV